MGQNSSVQKFAENNLNEKIDDNHVTHTMNTSNEPSSNHDHHSMHHGMDHAGMNHHMGHGGVVPDHSGMADNPPAHAAAGGACGGNGHAMHGMSMAFHGGYCETVLFECWKISSINGLVGSFIGIIVMAALYEGLKYYRLYLFSKTYNTLQCRRMLMPAEQNVVVDENRIVHPTMLSWMHTFQTFLHIVQIVLSYCLMLIFMTYNTWLCIAVALGAAIGYFLFGWKKTVIVDVTEHCH